jgi:hypothetical protein
MKRVRDETLSAVSHPFARVAGPERQGYTAVNQ